jgi:hypothetical protein
MALRPPQHRADVLGHYIHPADDAWDVERINADTAAADAATRAEHPVARYWAGKTRFDLAAEGVRNWIRPGALPTIFVFRRLSLSEYTRVVDMGAVHAMWTECARVGLVEIVVDGEARKTTTTTLDDLYDIHPDLPHQVGLAVWQFNLPINEAEGKRSGSGGGVSSPAGPASVDGSK